jgi:hypothetical protein
LSAIHDSGRRRSSFTGKRLAVFAFVILLLGVLAFSQRASAESISPWGPTTNYPVNVEDQSCAVYSGYIYCVGGYIGNAASDPVYYAPVSSTGIGTWVRSPNNYPLGIDAESCVIGTDTSQFEGTTAAIYCVGGENSNGNTVDKVYAASVSSSGVGSWTALAAYPTAFGYASCVVYEEQYTSPPPLRITSTVPYITCVGGFTNSADTGAVYTFSSGTGTWTQDTNYPFPVADQSCVYYSSYIYCVGGFIVIGGNVFGNNGVDYAPVSSAGIGAWASTTVYPDSDIEALSCVPYSGYVYCVGGQVADQPVKGVYYAPLSSSGVGTWTAGNSYPVDLLGVNRASNLCVLYPGSDGYIYCVGNGLASEGNGNVMGSESIYYSEIIPPASTTTVVSTTTVPGPTVTTTSTVNSTSTTTVTAGANQTATVTTTSISPTTITQTSTETTTEDSTLTATSTVTAISTETLTNPETSTTTVTTTVPQTVSVATGATPNETVTSTVQKTVTSTSGGSPDLTPYLIVGVAIVLAGGLLAAAMLRLRRPK